MKKNKNHEDMTNFLVEYQINEYKKIINDEREFSKKEIEENIFVDRGVSLLESGITFLFIGNNLKYFECIDRSIPYFKNQINYLTNSNESYPIEGTHRAIYGLMVSSLMSLKKEILLTNSKYLKKWPFGNIENDWQIYLNNEAELYSNFWEEWIRKKKFSKELESRYLKYHFQFTRSISLYPLNVGLILRDFVLNDIETLEILLKYCEKQEKNLCNKYSVNLSPVLFAIYNGNKDMVINSIKKIIRFHKKYHGYRWQLPISYEVIYLILLAKMRGFNLVKEFHNFIPMTCLKRYED